MEKLHPNILLMTLFCLFMINQSNAQNSTTVIEPGPEHYSSKYSLIENRTTQTSPLRNVNTNNSEPLNKAFNLSGKSNSVAAQPAVNCYIPPDNTYTNFPGNDDGSTLAIPLPFTFSLYGINYTSVYINNNGNLTFTGPSGVYDPVGFPFNVPMVAPFWADVDTRIGNTVKYKINPTNLIVTWPGVGYFNQQINLLNTFQVIISNGNDSLIGLGNNVAFYYGEMQWTTGSASGGAAGFGGFPATAGINQGDGINYIQIGRFNQNNANYGGPLSGTSGVNYLDYSCYQLTAGSLSNLQPSVSGIPANNTLNIACGATGTINLTALPPEVGQNVSVAIDTGGLCNATIVNATSGTSSNATVTIVGGACNQGSHNISFVFTDNFNPSASTTVNITVVIGTAPVISCPSNITVSNTSGQCGANVTYPAATATGTSPTITYSHASGGFFPVGTTTVTVSATNACGSDTCTFEVTVDDTQPPSITCPANITDVIATSASGAVVNYTAPVGTDNCPDATTVRTDGLASGATFPIGTTTVTHEVTDAAGLTAQCSFTVTVVGVAPQIACPANISVNNAANQCSANVSFAATETVGIPASTITYSPASGSLFPVGTTTVTATATNDMGSSSCTFSVTVNDTQAPTITCPANISGVIATSANGAVVNYTAPVGTDNCPDATTVRTDGLASGATFPIGTTTVTHEVTDAAGLTAQCSFTVTVVGVAPQIACPANITVNNATNQCGANISFTATETVGIPASTITYSPLSGSLFPVGTTTVTATATNAVGTNSCTFTVTVNDTQPPSISCPANIDVDLSAGQCGAFVSFAATASDNCGTANITYSHAPGSLFNVGTTTVTATANDGNGNETSCTFTVTVDLLDHVNLQWPPDAAICPGGSFTAYGQVYEPNVTTVPGSQGANIEVQFGYNTTNTNPSGWSNWFAASYNQDFNGNPNNDEYYYNFSSNTPGTYYYTFRYRQNGCAWQYGGFQQWDGGTWDGTNNVSGVLTVQSLDWANLQWPPSATICQGSSITAYGQVYEPGVTTVPGVRGAGIDVQFGYNTANTNPSGWSNWTTLNSSNFNALGGGPANDEYFYNFTPPTSGTFYYTFRYRLNGCSWQYGGYSGPGGFFWDGTNHVSGVLTVSPTTVAGTVSGGTSICPGETSALLTLSGYTGLILRWESSVFPFLSWNPIANNNNTYTSEPLSETTKFRAIVQSGVCPSQTSGETTVIVYLTYPFYADNDDDGYGAGPVAYLCSDAANNPPAGYTVDGTDCDDTLGDRHKTFPFFVDADGDGYGAEGSTAVELCAIDGNTPPEPNYSVNDDDCNDLVFAINPGVAEIPFDNIDNNCNGSLYDGHPLIVVNVLSPSCGGINHGLNNTLNCTEVYLGEGYIIGYRFKVTNLTTGEVDYVDRVQHHFKLTDTDIYAYGTSYSIQVAAIVNGEVQGYNGAVCTLTTTTVATTKVVNSQCGSTLLFMTSTINANSVNSAITYRFRVARADAPTVYYYTGERNLPNFNLTMLTVPVGFLTYATEYKVDVQIKIKLANIIAWSQFGQVCSIFTPQPPTSSIVVSQCELIATSNTQVISATPFAGATLYRFLLTHYDEFGILDYEQYQDSPTSSFTLSMFTGLLPNTTYTVSVSMQLYGTFVPYDKDCSITTPPFAKSEIEIPFNATVYPNPYTANFMIDVKTTNIEAIDIKVYDMIGRLVEQKVVNVNDLKNAPIGERYPSGVYNVVLSQGEEVRTLRVIKR